MRLIFNPEIRSLIDLVKKEIRPNQELYIVGGAIRDMLIGRKNHDLDFVMADNPTALAKQLANRLGVGYFILDDERHTARVMFHREDGGLSPIDFVQFTGDTLYADLENRDFTINAMAVPIHDLTNLLDPLNGKKDLTEGIIRACSDHALLDDPVRVLRGIRQAIQFEFAYAPGLEDEMREAAVYLSNTSYERQRDEFVRILEGKNPGQGMADCRRFNVFDTLIPPLVEQAKIPASAPHTLPLFDHTIRVVEYYDLILKLLCSDQATEKEPAMWWQDLVVSELGHFASEINDYFQEEITPGRSKRSLALIGALLHDIGKPQSMKKGEDGYLHYYGHDRLGADLAWESTKRLQMSNAESEWIRILVRYHMRLIPMITIEAIPSHRTIYRFFKKAGEVGVAIALHSLADTLATYETTLSHQKWEKAVNVSRTLLSAWWEHHQFVVAPIPLLDGNDLIKMFDLVPGKALGKLLGDIKEAQAAGEITTEQEAREFIRDRLAKKRIQKDRHEN